LLIFWPENIILIQEFIFCFLWFWMYRSDVVCLINEAELLDFNSQNYFGNQAQIWSTFATILFKILRPQFHLIWLFYIIIFVKKVDIKLVTVKFCHYYLRESFSDECVTARTGFPEPSDTFVCPLEPDRAWPPLWACPSANTFETGRPDKPSAGACWSRSRWKQGSCSRCCL
jgi:hypothetical protein